MSTRQLKLMGNNDCMTLVPMIEKKRKLHYRTYKLIGFVLNTKREDNHSTSQATNIKLMKPSPKVK